MHDLKICFEYRAAVAGEYREMDGPATGSPPVEIRAADAQSIAMTTRRALNLSERIELQAWLRAGESQAEIARRLGRSAGAISGELRRNGGRDGYQAEMADRGCRTSI